MFASSFVGAKEDDALGVELMGQAFLDHLRKGKYNVKNSQRQHMDHRLPRKNTTPEKSITQRMDHLDTGEDYVKTLNCSTCGHHRKGKI